MSVETYEEWCERHYGINLQRLAWSLHNENAILRERLDELAKSLDTTAVARAALAGIELAEASLPPIRGSSNASLLTKATEALDTARSQFASSRYTDALAALVAQGEAADEEDLNNALRPVLQAIGWLCDECGEEIEGAPTGPAWCSQQCWIAGSL